MPARPFPTTQEEVIQRFPRLVAHMICESLGYFTPLAAANALPRGHHLFAEKLLLQALQVAGNEQDRACAHANLAQLYFELRDRLPDAHEKCRRHCEATLRTGLFTCWVTKILKELEEGEAGGANCPL